MANVFLKVDKDLFKLGLNPTEILILAQVKEFETNTGDCFISDKTLAENFGVSESTIKREMKKLEELGYIVRDTKNVKGGKERHIRINNNTTSVNLSLDSNYKCQNEPCTSVNLSLDKCQNDTIKDNIKDKELKNNYELLPNGNNSATAQCAIASTEPEEVEDNSQQAQIMTTKEALARFGLSACANRVSSGIANCYWIDGQLVRLV